MQELERTLSETTSREEKLLQYAERLIQALQQHCREHPSHIRMYTNDLRKRRALCSRPDSGDLNP